MGGTMRLGLRPTVFQPGSEWSKVKRLYGGSDTIWERHRHRYEVNPAFVERLEKGGLIFTGRDERGERMQVAELRDHPYFVGMQAHPEYCSRPLNPSPGFLGFVAASCGLLDDQLEAQRNYVRLESTRAVLMSQLMPHPSRHLRCSSAPIGRALTAADPSPIPSPAPSPAMKAQETLPNVASLQINGVSA